MCRLDLSRTSDNIMDPADIAYFFSNGTYNADAVKSKQKQYHRDYKLYRKEIFYLFKDVMLKKNTDEDLVRAFDQFCRAGIEYLQFREKAHHIQQEYADLSGTPQSPSPSPTPTSQESADALNATNEILYEHLTTPAVKTIDQCIPIKRIISSKSQEQERSYPQKRMYPTKAMKRRSKKGEAHNETSIEKPCKNSSKRKNVPNKYETNKKKTIHNDTP